MMARQRDYKAEYAARQQRARDRGAASYNVERREKEKAKYGGRALAPISYRGMPAPQRRAIKGLPGHLRRSAADNIHRLRQRGRDSKGEAGVRDNPGKGIKGEAEMADLYDELSAWGDEYLDDDDADALGWYHEK